VGEGPGRLTPTTVAVSATLALAACGGGGVTEGAPGSTAAPVAAVDRGDWLAADRERREAIASRFIDRHPALCPEGLGARQLAIYVTGSIAAERDDRGGRSLDLPVDPVLREWCLQSQGG
jgi:hypothetical protein